MFVMDRIDKFYLKRRCYGDSNIYLFAENFTIPNSSHCKFLFKIQLNFNSAYLAALVCCNHYLYCMLNTWTDSRPCLFWWWYLQKVCQPKALSAKESAQVLLCHSVLMICCKLWVGVCMEMYESFDWRHTTAGSDYKDMVQIAGDYSFTERWQT